MKRDSLAGRMLLTLAVVWPFLAACPEPRPEPEAPVAQPPENLPRFEPCDPATAPVLPAKWAASALMQPFDENPPWVGRFTYDEQARAYRFAVAEAGQTRFFDYLLTSDMRLYTLRGPYDKPTGCESAWRIEMQLPARELVSSGATCVGEAALLGTQKQWWKQASDTTPGANWYWFDAEPERSLFRVMPYGPVDNLGLPGYFAFSYYTDFRALSETDLPKLVELCRSGQPAAEKLGPAEELGNAGQIREVLDRLLPEDTAAPAAATAGPVVPGIGSCSSPDDRPRGWPDQLEMTTFLTAVNVEYSPFPSLVRYNWSVPGLRTDMYNPWPMPDKEWNLYSARLIQETGFSVYYLDGTFESCNQDLPGPEVPDWMQVDACTCQAVLAPRSALNPSPEEVLVMRCPLTPMGPHQTPQVFWTWYGARTGKPVVFMQTNSSASVGTGLNLADYYLYAPGKVTDPSVYAPPEQCLNQKKQDVPVQCHNCHLPTNSEPVFGDPVHSHVPALRR